MKITDEIQLLKLKRNASRDGFKKLVQHCDSVEKEVLTLCEMVNDNKLCDRILALELMLAKCRAECKELRK